VENIFTSMQGLYSIIIPITDILGAFVYLFKNGFTSPEKLYLTMGHEYIHAWQLYDESGNDTLIVSDICIADDYKPRYKNRDDYLKKLNQILAYIYLEM
jgi:hypothetical protein